MCSGRPCDAEDDLRLGKVEIDGCRDARRTGVVYSAERRHAASIVEQVGVLAPHGEVAVDEDLSPPRCR